VRYLIYLRNSQDFGAKSGNGMFGMLQDDPTRKSPIDADHPTTRVGDLAAMLRVMRPLNGSMPDHTVGRRRLLADLCRFIGVKVGTLPPESLGFPPTPTAGGDSPDPVESIPEPVSELSPRLEQTLRHLLGGDSEKQVARKLALSQHTVHVYVKALYRRFEVSSRAELLAKHLKK
jgi:DNA-binding CsgD family transcriptional regulator